MKHIAKSLVVVGAMMAAGSVGADMFSDFNPYVGVDYYHAWMKGRSKGEVQVSQIFPKSYPGATIYIGNKFTENLGLELGFDWSFRAKKNFSTVDADDGNTVTGTTKIRRIGGHLDLVGFLPMNECVNLFASIGYGWIKPKVTIQSLAPVTESLSFSGKSNSVIRLGIGADWMVTDMFGLRAKAGWETTSMLRLRETTESSSEKFKAFRNSATLAAGGFVKF